MRYGRKKVILEIFQDITDLREGEREILKLTHAIEQSPSEVVITDLQGNIEYVNPKFTQITGYAFDEAVGRPSNILKSGRQSKEVYDELWSILESGGEWRGEFCNKKKNGELFWEAASISTVKDEKGVPIRYIKVAEDITISKQAQEKMREFIAMKEHFISMASHELRSPLAGIKEGVGIVLDGTIGEITDEQREFLSIAKKNVDRLSRLVSDVLDFQKLHTGSMEFYFEENDLNEIIEEVHQTLGPVAKAKGLELILSLDRDIPKVVCDKDRITQVLINLVNNAVKFTDIKDNTSGNIIILASKRSGNTVVVSVKDSGPGIQKEDIPKLFHSYAQLVSTKSKRVDGTGLGLAICKEIVSGHGGKIWVESKAGEGAVFLFLIPI